MTKTRGFRIGRSAVPRGSACVRCLVAVTLAALAATRPAAAGDHADHSEFDVLLRKYVSPEGVRYAEWRASTEDRAALDVYLEGMQEIQVSRLHASPDGRTEALAFWINLYNAATLRLVLDGYPVGSIKELGELLKSPWEKDLVVVEGRRLTLNEIENDMIRPVFQEPRVHFALNCAARSCPPLRAEAYVPERLDEQLDDQTRRFLVDETNNRMEPDGRLRLSKILDWYSKDFGGSSRAVAEWVRPYVPALARLQDAEGIDVRYGSYEWALNDASDRR